MRNNKWYSIVLTIGCALSISLVGCDRADMSPTGVEGDNNLRPTSIQLDKDGPIVQLGIKRAARHAKGSAIQAAASNPLNGCNIAYDLSHNTGRQFAGSPEGGLHSALIADLEGRGATIATITDFTRATLDQYEVLWLEEDPGLALNAAEQTILLDWVTDGGNVLITGDSWAESSPHIPFESFYFGAGFSGTTTQITAHPTTMGVTSLEFPDATSGLLLPGAGVSLAAQNGVDYAWALEVGTGKVVAISDELLQDGSIGQADNQTFANNIFTWFCPEAKAKEVEASIDIIPYSNRNRIFCRWDFGVIPVAILSDANLDATTIDLESVRFQGAQHAIRHWRSNELKRFEFDIDHDGDKDLLIIVRKRDTDLTCNSTTGTVTGVTTDGTTFKGTDNVQMF